MIHAFYSQDYPLGDMVCLMEGPAELDVNKLLSDFTANFDERGLGEPIYPDWHGAAIKNINEYSMWLDICSEIGKQWKNKREQKLLEFKEKYPGENVGDMFISYLKIEFDFKQLDCALWGI